MTRDEAFTEAARVLVDACAEVDALPAEQVAQRAHAPGDPYSISDLVALVRAQRAEAQGKVA